MGNLKFNGKSTEELGLVIQTPPSYTFPEKDMSSIHVPGRSGDLYIDNKCYKNVDRVYSIAKQFRPGTKLYSNAGDILAWLTSANGKYARLEDSYDSEVYRLATFNMQGSFVNYFDKATSIDITFNCKPQRFLKTGENVIKNLGSDIKIENLTGYYSLPSIELVNVPSEVDDVLMMTVKDSKGQDVSNVTLSHVGQADPNNVVIVIDSEEQSIVRKYPDRTENVSAYVGLNGLPFPELRDGVTRIQLQKYESEGSGKIQAYDSFMNDKAEKIDSLYKPVERIASENEKKILIRSWNTLIAEARKTNTKESYQSFAQTEAKSYLFESVNNVLDSLGKSTMEFTGIIGDDLPVYDFVEIVDGPNDTYKARAKISGYFMVKGADGWKTLKYFDKSDSEYNLFTDVKNSSVVQIMYYPEDPNAPTGTHRIKIDFGEDAPDWITIDITSTDGPYWSPQRITFKTSNAVQGYFFKPKSSGLIAGLFSKDKWLKCDHRSADLNSVEWNTSKKAFTSTEGITKQTNVTFEFKFLEVTIDELTGQWILPQYKADKSIKEEVYFSIYELGSESDNALKTMGLKANKDGWYLLTIGEAEDSLNYKYKKVGEDLNTDGISGTENFKVSYLPEDTSREFSDSDHPGQICYRPLVNYKKEKGWPDWLSPYPLDSQHNEFNIEPPGGNITFKLANINDTEDITIRLIYNLDINPDTDDIEEFVEESYPDHTQWPQIGVIVKEKIYPYDTYIWKYDTIESKWYKFGLYKDYINKFYMYYGADETIERDVLAYMSPKRINSDTYTIQNNINDDKSIPPTGEELMAPPDYSFYIYQINKIPQKFNEDRSVITYNDDGSVKNEVDFDVYNSDPEAFVHISIIGDPPEEGSEDEDTRQISYRASKDGYYKWGTNTAWVYKHKDDELSNGLLMTNLKEDLKILYMTHLPEYTEDDIPELFDNVELKPSPEETLDGGDNPTAIIIKVKQNHDGYYRVNNVVDWKYFKSGETILVSKVNETNEIFHLKPKGETLDNMEINIIPRWWTL